MKTLRAVMICVVDHETLSSETNARKAYAERHGAPSCTMMRVPDLLGNEWPAMIGTADEIPKLLQLAEAFLDPSKPVAVGMMPKIGEA